MFIPNYLDLSSPLTDLTKKEVTDPVQWTELCQQAFTQVKAALCGGPLLHSPDFFLPFLLQTDTSDRGLGAVLSQEIEGEERPVLYISGKLSKRETMYSTIEKECLAIWIYQCIILLLSEFVHCVKLLLKLKIYFVFFFFKSVFTADSVSCIVVLYMDIVFKKTSVPQNS